MPRNAPAPRPGIPHDPPVVLVVFDALPVRLLEDATGHIDSERFPNFAALARTGTWYRNATTIHESTRFSVPAILDGERPRPGVAETLQGHPGNLLTILGRRYLHGSFIPAHVTGWLRGARPAGRILAFALNGTIVATAPSCPPLGASRINFSAMLPEDRFVQGRNSLAVYELTGSGVRRL
jgi:hypothetical protein